MPTDDELREMFLVEAERIREYLTPLSVIMGVQVAVLLFFIQQEWIGPFEIGFSITGNLMTLIALEKIVYWGIKFKWEPQQTSWSVKTAQRSRQQVGYLTIGPLGAFALSMMMVCIRLASEF